LAIADAPLLIERCRACGSGELRPVIDLGEQVQQGFFPRPGQPLPVSAAVPLRLVRCAGECGLLQLDRSLPASMLYGRYWYRSGTNATMRDHLRGIVESALALTPRPVPTVLDIGCNDGTLLSCYPVASRRYGVDPSDIVTSAADIATIHGLFPDDPAVAALPSGGFDVITTIAMFYDLDDPVRAAREIARLLAVDGIWIVELSYLPLMLARNGFDTICHEHLTYYSLAVIDHVARAAGLRVFRAELNDCNGGSIRCFVCPAANPDFGDTVDSAFLDRLRAGERALRLDEDAPYLDLQRRAETLRGELRDFLTRARDAGERIHVYGASTKGNVLLQYCGIGPELIDCAADRNPHKHGTVTPGTGIPIVSEAQSRALAPDWYLVLPWHFRREFLEREREMILSGTRLLFPLPALDVVDAGNYGDALAVSAALTDWLPCR